MGSLSDLDVDDIPDDASLGEGKSLVEWWDAADEEDRATLRRWVDEGSPARVIAERITTTGWKISRPTVAYGIRLLRRHRWES